MIEHIKMTEGELSAHIRKYISDAYEEIDQYTTVVDEDLLTTGLHRFGIKLTQAWGWGHRIMNLIREGKCMSPVVSQLVRGKQRLLEEQLFTWKRANRRTSLMGLDAKEREQAALLEKVSYVNEYEFWVQRQDELKSCLAILNMKLKDLKDVRNDIRSVLGNVRTQGALGETPVDGSDAGQSDSSVYGKVKVPKPHLAGLKGNATEDSGPDVDIDSLLNPER